MINNVKIKVDSVKEAVRALEILFANGHTWRGGSISTSLSEYEVNNLIGLYVGDDFYSQDKAVITFETDCIAFWSERDHLIVTPEQIGEFYK